MKIYKCQKSISEFTVYYLTGWKEQVLNDRQNLSYYSPWDKRLEDAVHWERTGGQYNIAKVLRASADAIARRAAYQLGLSKDTATLIEELERAAGVLANHEVNHFFHFRGQ